jgi:tripartite-type tricarboxylate transporter receptor subunit TctC
LGLLAAAGPALAQAWPQRPITLIVPFAAGGGTDAFARPFAQQLDTQLGVRVLVENRAGAGGTTGAAAAAKAEPDGYTFFVGAAITPSRPRSIRSSPTISKRISSRSASSRGRPMSSWSIRKSSP